MIFDAYAALAKIQHQGTTPATSATLRHTPTSGRTKGAQTHPKLAECRNVANVAVGRGEISKTASSSPPPQKSAEVLALDAIRTGYVRHGVVATKTMLGATVTYRLLDRLIAEGRVAQAKDGTLSIITERQEA